jgi:hypothetical protein
MLTFYFSQRQKKTTVLITELRILQNSTFFRIYTVSRKKLTYNKCLTFWTKRITIDNVNKTVRDFSSFNKKVIVYNNLIVNSVNTKTIFFLYRTHSLSVDGTHQLIIHMEHQYIADITCYINPKDGRNKTWLKLQDIHCQPLKFEIARGNRDWKFKVVF